MQLEQLSVVLRPRRPWQAIDLGFRMTVRWWRELMTLWFCISLPWFVVCALPLANRDAMFVAPLLMWWSKPVLERPLLYFASRAVFGEQPTVRDVLKNLGNIVRPQALSWLLWRRLSPTRSFDMPVTLLEGLNGRDRGTRISILHMNQATPASWLTLLGVHVETFLALAVLVLVETMLPAQMQWRWFSGIEDSSIDYAVWYLLSYIGMSMVAPFYVVCGFALYLNRRAQLEAWDIEIAFRRLREKHSTLSGMTLLLCAAVLTGGLALPAQTHASAPVAPANAVESRQRIGEVMQRDEFNERITYKVPKWFDSKPEADTPEWMRKLQKWLKQLRDKDSDISKVSLLIARVLEFLLWTVLIVGVALMAWRYRAFLRQWLPSRTPSRPRVWRMRRLATREGIDLDVLPALDDIGDNARLLWEQHEHRAAMALLYVASLFELSASDIPLDDSHTELECLQLAQQHLNPEATGYFVDITMAWLRMAYAHNAPTDAEFFAFCDNWREFMRQIHVSSIAMATKHQADLQADADTQRAGAAHA